MPSPGPALRPGDRAIDFTRADQRGKPFAFYERRCGQPTVLLVAPVLNGPAATVLETLAERFRGDGAAGLATLRLDRAPLPEGLAGADPETLAVLDDDGAVTASYTGSRVPVGTTAFVLDPTLRVVAALPLDGAPDALAAAIGAALDALPARPPRRIASAGPVLIVPGTIGPGLRRRLVDYRESRPDAGGASRRRPSRRGRTVEDDELARALGDRIERRVLPELDRAFHYRVGRYEVFRIVRQTAPGPDAEAPAGRRRPGREETPGRRFLLAIALDDDAEGGGLRLPEFGPEIYDPPPGAALVVSCAHLREMLEPTAGRRLTLVTHFHDAAERRRRAFF